MRKLSTSVRGGDLAQVRALLDEGADPNEARDEHGTTVLTDARFFGHVEIVRLLLERGADVERPNKFGARPLSAAAINARLRVIPVLLKAGASLTAEGDDGLTAFMQAASGTPETVRLFLKHGVDVNAVSSKGYTALQCAAINDRHGPAISPLLLEAGADPSHRDRQGRTPRDLAVERGRDRNAAVLDAHTGAPSQERSGAKTKLKLVDPFREFGYESGPSIADLKRGTPMANKKAVVDYLKNGASYILTPGLRRDVFDPTGERRVLMHIVTDGRFAWHLALAHYVDRYDLELPADFREHMASNGFKVPDGVDPLMLDLWDDR